MSDNAIKQDVFIDAPPEKVFDALTNSDTFGAVTGAPASIGTGEGDRFERFNGQITGRNIEKVAGRRLVEAWRPGNWPEGVYSIASFELEPEGSGTRLRFSQAGHPEDAREMLESGWDKMYWQPLKAHLEQEKAGAE